MAKQLVYEEDARHKIKVGEVLLTYTPAGTPVAAGVGVAAESVSEPPRPVSLRNGNGSSTNCWVSLGTRRKTFTTTTTPPTGHSSGRT